MIVHVQLKTHVLTRHQHDQIQKVSIILNRQSERSSYWEANNRLGSRSTAAVLQHGTNSTPSSHTRVKQTSLSATFAFLLYTVSFQKIHCPHSKGRTIKFFKHGFSSRNIYIFIFLPRDRNDLYIYRRRRWCGVKKWGRRGCREDRLLHADVKRTYCKLSKENTSIKTLILRTFSRLSVKVEKDASHRCNEEQL